MAHVDDPSVLVRRRRGTAETRRRIVSAALELFSTRGYGRTTLQAVADAAGVHVQTVYSTFGSKPAVLAAATELARAGEDDPEAPPADWPWARALVADPDAASRLRRYAAHVREIAPRAGPLLAEIRSAARSDPDLAAFLIRVEAGRYLGPRGIVELLAADDRLRRGLDPEQAADTLYAVASFEGYELLVSLRGWTPDEYERWLGDVLCQLLLDHREA